jgi:hypothetical protein
MPGSVELVHLTLEVMDGRQASNPILCADHEAYDRPMPHP